MESYSLKNPPKVVAVAWLGDNLAAVETLVKSPLTPFSEFSIDENKRLVLSSNGSFWYVNLNHYVVVNGITVSSLPVHVFEETYTLNS